MDEQELANECMLTAIALIRDEIDGGETWTGNLYLTEEGETWDVYYQEQTGRDEMLIYVDTLQPGTFGSAQILGAYLKRLHSRDAETVDLPKSAGHMGQLLE